MLDIFSRKKVKSNLIFFLSTSCKDKQKLLLVYTQSLVLNASCSVLSCSWDDFKTTFSQSFEVNFCPIRTRGRPCEGAGVCQAKVTSSSRWSWARSFICFRCLNSHQNSKYFPDLPKQMAHETCTEFALLLNRCYGHTCNKWTLIHGPNNILMYRHCISDLCLTKFLAVRLTTDSSKLTVTTSRDCIKLREHKESNQFSELVNNSRAYF